MDINTNINMNNKKVIDTIEYNGRCIDVDIIKKKVTYAVALLVAMASALILFFL